MDDMRAYYRGMIMCHMLATSTDELLAFAEKIGVHRKWLQRKGTVDEHFDISLTMKQRALLNGARQITQRMAGAIVVHRRHHPGCTIRDCPTPYEGGTCGCGVGCTSPEEALEAFKARVKERRV